MTIVPGRTEEYFGGNLYIFLPQIKVSKYARLDCWKKQKSEDQNIMSLILLNKLDGILSGILNGKKIRKVEYQRVQSSTLHLSLKSSAWKTFFSKVLHCLQTGQKPEILQNSLYFNFEGYTVQHLCTLQFIYNIFSIIF